MAQPHKKWLLPWRMLAFSHSFHYSSLMHHFEPQASLFVLAQIFKELNEVFTIMPPIGGYLEIRNESKCTYL